MTVTQTVVREFEIDLVVREPSTSPQDVVAMTLARASTAPTFPTGRPAPTST